MATSERTRPAAAVVIVVAFLVALGGWWWSNRDTTPQVGDQGQVTASVGEECVGLSVEFGGVDFAVPVEMAPDGARGWPSAWRGQEVDGTIEITEREGSNIRGTFTSNGTVLPVTGAVGGSFRNAACLGWPQAEPAGS